MLKFKCVYFLYKHNVKCSTIFHVRRTTKRNNVLPHVVIHVFLFHLPTVWFFLDAKPVRPVWIHTGIHIVRFGAAGAQPTVIIDGHGFIKDLLYITTWTMASVTKSGANVSVVNFQAIFSFEKCLYFLGGQVPT